jgi:phage-related protein
MSREARIEVGALLRRLQRGEALSMPESRPMPVIGSRCHELRVHDTQHKIEWRVIYYTGHLAVAILDVFKHDSRTTPEAVIASSKRRLAQYTRLEKP